MTQYQVNVSLAFGPLDQIRCQLILESIGKLRSESPLHSCKEGHIHNHGPQTRG